MAVLNRLSRAGAVSLKSEARSKSRPEPRRESLARVCLKPGPVSRVSPGPADNLSMRSELRELAERLRDLEFMQHCMQLQRTAEYCIT